MVKVSQVEKRGKSFNVERRMKEVLKSEKGWKELLRVKILNFESFGEEKR